MLVDVQTVDLHLCGNCLLYTSCIQLHRGGLALAVTHRDVACLGFLGTQNQHIRHTEYYPGTDAPADYVSYIRDAEPVSMNRILSRQEMCIRDRP